MTEATREALERVDAILQQAGWDQQPAAQAALPSAEDLSRIRHAYETLLRHDHFEILQTMLGAGLTLAQAAEKMGLSAEEASRLFAEALRRLGDFVECYEKGNPPRGTAAVSDEPARQESSIGVHKPS